MWSKTVVNYAPIQRQLAPVWGHKNMTELQNVVQSTLLAEGNQASVSAMLDSILETPLTPMEANQAKSYMEQVATQAANDEGAEIQLLAHGDEKPAHHLCDARRVVLQ